MQEFCAGRNLPLEPWWGRGDPGFRAGPGPSLHRGARPTWCEACGHTVGRVRLRRRGDPVSHWRKRSSRRHLGVREALRLSRGARSRSCGSAPGPLRSHASQVARPRLATGAATLSPARKNRLAVVFCFCDRPNTDPKTTSCGDFQGIQGKAKGKARGPEARGRGSPRAPIPPALGPAGRAGTPGAGRQPVAPGGTGDRVRPH